jgi:hypothetical protein
MAYKVFILLCFTSNLISQGIINNGATIVFSGSAQAYISGGTNGDYTSQNAGTISPSATSIISLEGDWTNNSANTGFNADAGTIKLTGSTQAIGGTNSTTFYNLNLLGSGTKTLNINSSVGGVTTKTGILTMGSQVLDLNQKILTITNNTTSGINSSSTGFIISETNLATNPSIVQWNVGTGTGSYIIPFGKTSTKIPLTINITSAMSSSSSNFKVATRATGSNNTPWTTGVTNMYDRTVNGDGSIPAVIDRWWDFTFSHAATASITFNYLSGENTLSAPYNTSNIGAQYWTNATGWIPDNSSIGSASINTPLTATGIPFPAATLRPMVLSSLSAPLPVELKNFSANCINDIIELNWSTISESNNDFFTLEKSYDGINYTEIAQIDGNGTSTQINSYSYQDEKSQSEVYYRLKQTDFNGTVETFAPITINCFSNEDIISIQPNPNGGKFTLHGLKENNLIIISDLLGKIIYQEKARAENMEVQLNEFSFGMYNVQIIDNDKSFVKKLIIE